MSYLFDGVDDYLSDGTNGGVDLDVGTYSIMAWAKVGTLTSSTGHVMGRASGSHNEAHMVMRLVRSEADAGQDIFRQGSSEQPSDGAGWVRQDGLHHSVGLTAWDCVIGTFDYDGTRIPRWDAHINGAGSFTYGNGNVPVFGATNHFTIGTVWDSANRPFDGYIAHVAIWNRVLTAQEITDLSAGSSPLTAASSGLLRYWPLTADAATQVDEAGSGHDLTVYGATFSTDDPAVDAAAPVLSSTAKTSSTVDLSWTDTGSAEWQVDRDGTRIAVTSALTYQDTGLDPATEYTYRVRGRDIT